MTMNLNELVRGGTMCLSKAGLAEGTNDYTIKTAAPNGAGIDYAINGIVYHLADADNLTLTAADAQADLTTCLYLICLNAAGTLSSVKGTEVLTASLTAGTEVLEWPTPAVDTCPIGAIKVANSAGTFTAGSTDLGAATVTDTYYDLFSVPVAPLTS